MTRSILKNRPSSIDSGKDFFELFEDSPQVSEGKAADVERSTIVDETNEIFTRQTFMISEVQLDKLKDFVHTMKKTKDYNYSQKQAISDALNLLFGSVQTIEKRNTIGSSLH